MSESKHTPTPGPWTIEEYGDEDAPALVIHKDSESRICFMATPGSHGDPAQIEADARLIAAAPDFLAAVKTTQCPRPANSVPDELIELGWTVSDCVGDKSCGCDLGAALAKATGSET